MAKTRLSVSMHLMPANTNERIKIDTFKILIQFYRFWVRFSDIMIMPTYHWDKAENVKVVAICSFLNLFLISNYNSEIKSIVFFFSFSFKMRHRVQSHTYTYKQRSKSSIKNNSTYRSKMYIIVW